MNADGLRVLVIAQDALAGVGLATLLGGQPGCVVVGQANGLKGWSALLESPRPEAVALDLGWSSEEALDGLRDLVELGLPVVALVADGESAAEAWSNGATGVVSRTSSGERLASALETVVLGLTVLDPEVASIAVPGDMAAREAPAGVLTARELDVLRSMAEGMGNKTIARRLAISEHTVKFHVTSIFGKLQVRSRTEAVTRATRLGLILL